MIVKSLPLTLFLATALAGCASTDPYTGSSHNQVINATTGQETDIAYKKMRALCEH
jgi:hypothetical protein